MGTYMIPRDTKGEGRILFIFSTKALMYTAGGAVIGIPFYYLFKLMNLTSIGVGAIVVLALLGFAIGTFKMPNAEGIKMTKFVSGENIDEIIIRYIKFRRRKNKIYIAKEEEK